MSKIKAVVTDYIEPDLRWEMEQAAGLGIHFEHHQLKFASAQELIGVCKDADIVVVNMARFDREVIDGLEKTRLIIRHGIGYDNVDIDAASARGILVGYNPDYCISEVAEQAMMLIFACQRKIHQQFEILRVSSQAKNWDFNRIMPVFSLKGKTVGIVGLGRIGGTLFGMLKGFDLNILVTDPYLSAERKAQFGVEPVPLEELIRASDVISIHCPLKWEDTYHMFDVQQFQWMKKNAILINTARGGIINLDALDTALRQGELAMAGIDVYEEEPPPPDHPILANEKALCTPHLSWLSEEAGWNIRHKIMADIERFTQGLPPVNQVNKEIGLRQAA